MTRLAEFVKGRTLAELYDIYWVPSALSLFAQNLARRVATGDRVLDLATGTGLVAAHAAECCGPRGAIVGYDPTPALLTAAKARAISAAPVRWVEGRAEDMPFDAASFDVVLCHQGLQYVADRERTFAEIARVLKPAGRFHASVWSSAADQSAYAFVEDSLARHFGCGFKPVHGWSFGGTHELRRLAQGAGLTVERLEQVEFPWTFDSIRQFVDVKIGCAGRTDDDGNFALGMVDLEDESWVPAIEAFHADARAALGKYEGDEGLSAPFHADEISATRS